MTTFSRVTISVVMITMDNISTATFSMVPVQLPLIPPLYSMPTISKITCKLYYHQYMYNRDTISMASITVAITDMAATSSVTIRMLTVVRGTITTIGSPGLYRDTIITVGRVTMLVLAGLQFVVLLLLEFITRLSVFLKLMQLLLW